MERHRRKLKSWLKNKDLERREYGGQVDYINLSDYHFNTYEDAILKRGEKHILDEDIHIKNSIPKIEYMLKDFEEEDRDKVRSKVQEIYERIMKTRVNDREDRRILSMIKNNENISCIKTDKTGKMAFLDRDDYIKRMKRNYK